MKFIAAQGNIQMQAQSGSIETSAAKNLTQQAHDTVHINAGKELLLTAGGGYIKLSGGNIEVHCPGAVSVKGASHNLSGPASMGASLPLMPFAEIPPLKRYSQQIDVGSMLYSDPELAGAPYEIWTKGDTARLLSEGFITDSGHSVRVFTENEEELELIVGESEWLSHQHFDDSDLE